MLTVKVSAPGLDLRMLLVAVMLAELVMRAEPGRLTQVAMQ